MVALINPNFTAPRLQPRTVRPARKRAESPAPRVANHPDIVFPEALEQGLESVSTVVSELTAAAAVVWGRSAAALRMVVLAMVVASALIGVRIAQGSTAIAHSESPTVGAEVSGSEIVLSVTD